jgi:hypothetical protein
LAEEASAISAERTLPGGRSSSYSTQKSAGTESRPHSRYKKLAASGKNKPQIVTAVGRELLGFVWAIAVKTEAKFTEDLAVAA